MSGFNPQQQRMRMMYSNQQQQQQQQQYGQMNRMPNMGGGQNMGQMGPNQGGMPITNQGGQPMQAQFDQRDSYTKLLHRS